MTLPWILIPFAALSAVLTLWVQRDWQPVGNDALVREAFRDRRGSAQIGSAMVPMAACDLGAKLKKQTESTGLPRPARRARVPADGQAEMAAAMESTEARTESPATSSHAQGQSGGSTPPRRTTRPLPRRYLTRGHDRPYDRGMNTTTNIAANISTGGCLPFATDGIAVGTTVVVGRHLTSGQQGLIATYLGHTLDGYVVVRVHGAGVEEWLPSQMRTFASVVAEAAA
jgi:hypothetical protein